MATMSNSASTNVAVAGASGGIVLALITITSRILASYGIAVDSDMAAALMGLFTPVVHILCMKYGLDPSPPQQGAPNA